MARLALGAVAILFLAGCSVVNEDDLSERLTAATTINAATLEVQHPGVPWENRLVVRLFVSDESAAGVAEGVREVADFAATDPDLSGEPLTFIAVPGFPEDYLDGGLAVSYLPVMASVSAIVGGEGVEGILELTAADVRHLADQE